MLAGGPLPSRNWKGLQLKKRRLSWREAASYSENFSLKSALKESLLAKLYRKVWKRENNASTTASPEKLLDYCTKWSRKRLEGQPQAWKKVKKWKKKEMKYLKPKKKKNISEKLRRRKTENESENERQLDYIWKKDTKRKTLKKHAHNYRAENGNICDWWQTIMCLFMKRRGRKKGEMQ